MYERITAESIFPLKTQASIEVREAGKRAVTTIHSTNLLHSSNKSLSEMGQEHHKPAENPSRLEYTVHSKKSPNIETGRQGITILHFNDVYNIESNSQTEPIGGAARFLTAFRSFSDLNPIVLFSGDVFSPSMLSFFTQGEEMVPVLNKLNTKCAVFGNHDFDHGLDVLNKWVERTTFPWLMSNVVDNETGRCLGGGKISHVIQHENRKIGLIGLVEREWLDTLPTIDRKEVTFLDFVEAGNQLADELKREGCDMIIALTHMRTPNDIELAKNCPSIDLILGGHDHVFEVATVNGIKIIKSGSDFRQFSKVFIDNQRDSNGHLQVFVEEVNVTAEYEEDKELKAELSVFSSKIEESMGLVLGSFCVDLDGRFSEIRTKETNLGNWVCDVILSATGVDVVLLNSGTFRSDQIHPAGPFTMRDLINVIPMRDPLVVLEMTGKALLEALENAVSAYPKLEGRFIQVAGISFAFDPTKPPMQRVEKTLVCIADEWLNLDQKYAVCVKAYMHGGCDGFTMLADCPILMDSEATPEIGLAIQNHFKAIDVKMGKGRHSKHRQSLVTLSRRHSMIQMLDNLELDGPSPVRRISIQKSIDCPNSAKQLLRRASIDDLEQQSCHLSPSVEHRIQIIQNPEHLEQLLRRRKIIENNNDNVIKEVDENS